MTPDPTDPFDAPVRPDHPDDPQPPCPCDVPRRRQSMGVCCESCGHVPGDHDDQGCTVRSGRPWPGAPLDLDAASTALLERNRKNSTERLTVDQRSPLERMRDSLDRLHAPKTGNPAQVRDQLRRDQIARRAAQKAARAALKPPRTLAGIEPAKGRMAKPRGGTGPDRRTKRTGKGQR